MSVPEKVEPFPVLQTDAEAEAFVDHADLSRYDFSQFKPAHFEFGRSEPLADIKIPRQLLDALADKAKRGGVPLTTYIRELLERDVAELQP